MADVVHSKLIYGFNEDGSRFPRGRYHIITDEYAVGHIAATDDSGAISSTIYREILRFDCRPFRRAWLYALIPTGADTLPHLDIRVTAYIRDYDDINDINIRAALPGVVTHESVTSRATHENPIALAGLGTDGLLQGAKAISIAARTKAAVDADAEDAAIPKFAFLADLEI